MGRVMLSSLKGMAHRAAGPARELPDVPPELALTVDSGSERTCDEAAGGRCTKAPRW